MNLVDICVKGGEANLLILLIVILEFAINTVARDSLYRFCLEMRINWPLNLS